VVRLVAREKNILKVKDLDAIDGTPLLDIKPYVPTVDETSDKLTDLKISEAKNKGKE